MPIKDHMVKSKEFYIERYTGFDLFDSQHEMIKLENSHLTALKTITKDVTRPAVISIVILDGAAGLDSAKFDTAAQCTHV